MIKEAELFADEDRQVRERVDARNALDAYIHLLRAAVEGAGGPKSLSEKLDVGEKGRSWTHSWTARHGWTPTQRHTPRRLGRSTRRSRASVAQSSPSTTG